LAIAATKSLNKKAKKIAVLCGGTTSEREISLNTGNAVQDALTNAGWEVILFDWPEAKVIDRAEELRAFDAVFIGYHGGAGEGGKVQAVLELANIPFTGSGSTGSAVAMDKILTKRIFAQAGIPTPKWIAWESETKPIAAEILRSSDLPLPIVVKPVAEGSTVGITIANSEETLDYGIDLAFKYSHRMLFEEYIPGRELTCAILEGTDLSPIEIVPHNGFYDYEHKYTAGASNYICPAEIPGAIAEELQNVSKAAFQLLGLRHYGRADFRYDGKKLFCLELNSLPGMTSLSLVPMAAQTAGISFPELVDRIGRMAINNGNIT